MKYCKQLLLLVSGIICSYDGWTAASLPVKQPHIKVSLLSNVEQITPGKSAFVGIYLQPEPHWHVYWQNPGDSGLAPKLRWQHTKGVNISEIYWPFPWQIPVQHLMNYGYKGDVLLPMSVTTEKSFDGDEIVFRTQASWLVCKEACVPGKAQLTLTLPVGKQALTSHSPEQSLFQETLGKVPTMLDLQGAPVDISENQVSFQLYANSMIFKQAETVKFFPITEDLVEYAVPPKIDWHNNVLRITQAKSITYTRPPPSIKGVIVIDNKQAWQFTIPQL